jgi:hypothetical protein
MIKKSILHLKGGAKKTVQIVRCDIIRGCCMHAPVS